MDDIHHQASTALLDQVERPLVVSDAAAVGIDDVRCASLMGMPQEELRPICATSRRHPAHRSKVGPIHGNRMIVARQIVRPQRPYLYRTEHVAPSLGDLVRQQ